MVTTAGQHEIRVLAGGKPVAGSPFALDVTPGQIRAGSCRLTGPGMHSVQLGREMRLAVHLADSFGNAIAAPGALEAHNIQVGDATRFETPYGNWVVQKPGEVPCGALTQNRR